MIIFSLISATMAINYLSYVDRALSSAIKNVGAVSTIDIITIENGKGIFDHVIKKLFLQQHEKSFQLIRFNEKDNAEHTVNNPIILFMESVESYKKFLLFEFDLNLSSYKHLKILIVCPDMTKEHIDLNDKFYRFTSFLMLEDGGLFLAYIKLHFQYGSAKKTKEVLNSMEAIGKWRHEEFFPSQTTNFLGFQFMFLFRQFTTRQYYRYVLLKDGRRQYIVNGLNTHIISIIKKLLNFTIFYNPTGRDRSTYPVKEHSVTFHYMPIQSFQKTKEVSVMPYECIHLKYVTSPGKVFTKYEKLFLAFDTQTWILIVVTFTIAFLTILVVKYMSKKIQGIVFGSRVHTPALNVIVAFFGLGQMTLPRRSFGRFLLMCFILYSMVIRTAYQGVSFDLLQKELRKPGIKTFEESVAKNFTVFVRSVFMEDWNETSVVKEKYFFLMVFSTELVVTF